MKFGKFVGCGAILGLAAAWLLTRREPELIIGGDGSTPRRLDASTPRAALMDPVSANRVLDPAAPVEASDASGDVTSVPPPETTRDYWVHLFDEANGAPVADAKLRILPFDDTADVQATPTTESTATFRRSFDSLSTFDAACPTTRTAGDGFAFLELPDRFSTFEVAAEGFGPARFNASMTQRNSRDQALEVALSRAASLEGLLLRKGRGPVTGGIVTLNFLCSDLIRPRPAVRRTRGRGVIGQVRTDGSGRFAFDGLPAGVPLALKLVESDSGGETGVGKVNLEPGERREIKWVYGARAHLGGRVVGRGSGPVADARVRVGDSKDPIRAWTTTNPAGEFTLDEVPVGDVELIVESDDEHNARVVLPLKLADDDRCDDLTIEMPAAAPLVVTAVDPEGTPVLIGLASARSLVTNACYGEGATRSNCDTMRASLPRVPLGDVIVRVVPSPPTSLVAADVTFHHDGEHEFVVQLQR